MQALSSTQAVQASLGSDYLISVFTISRHKLYKIDHMDLKQLEAFVRVAELGSFTRAADAMDMPQPALSRQVRQLEVSLRVTLLHRNGRGALPTDAGQLLLEHARGILHQVARAREALDRARGSLSGQVAIGLPPTLARVLTVPLTRAFREQLPHARLAVTEGLSTAMTESLLNGRLDIALLYNAQPSAGLEITDLGQEELMCVTAGAAQAATRAACQPVSVIELEALARQALVIPSRPNALRMHVEAALARHGLRPSIGLEIDGVAAILDLVADGAGAAVLSRSAVELSVRPQAYELQRIGAQGLHIPLYVAVSSLRPSTLTQQATLRLIQQTVQAWLGSPMASSAA
jgi:LysR family nitrogen assimilation transcriptional regulator